MGAIGDVLVAAGWPAGVITQDGLDWLMERLLSAQSADRLRLAGMREDRKAIIGGGVSVMRAVFKLLSITELRQAAGGLRHGLICDLLGNSDTGGDLRDRTVQRLAKKFNVDSTHGERVSKVVTQLFAPMLPSIKAWGEDSARLQRKLAWAAQLHEIGSHISHSDYHKHGAYILDNADAMGFSLSEMHRLSLLVLGHRGKLKKLETVLENRGFVIQLMTLRLAVILCHARRDPDMKGLSLQCQETDTQHWVLSCRKGWATTYPQSAYLLREEAIAWQKTPWGFEFQAD